MKCSVKALTSAACSMAAPTLSTCVSGRGGERMGIEAEEEEGGTHLEGGEVELAEHGLGGPPPAVGGGHEGTRAGRGGWKREDKLGRWVEGGGWYLARSSAKTGAQV